MRQCRDVPVDVPATSGVPGKDEAGVGIRGN